MEWAGEGTVLARRTHGENAVILTVMSREAGVLSGLVPGGAGKRRGPMLQPGNRLDLRWRARLHDQLGTFTPEPGLSRAHLMENRTTLAALNAVTALIVWSLPEHDPHPRLHDATETLLDRMSTPGWGADYLRWELLLLEEMGFGLSLDRCAVTGARDGLAFVSPRTGHAVTAAGAGEWADRLLPLPELLGGPPVEGAGLAQALALTGWFLNARMAEDQIGKPIPPARDRLLTQLRRDPAP